MKPSHSHSHTRGGVPQLAERLRRKSRKLTGPRQAIFDVLRRSRHPLSSKEIFAALPPGESDLATVYRSLHLLEGLKLVRRYDLGDAIARFELLAEGDDGHHHHLVCTRCSAVVELDKCFPREVERKIAADNGFASVSHRLEFFGICPRCQ